MFDKLFIWLIGFSSRKLDELLVGIALERLDAGFVPPARVTQGGACEGRPIGSLAIGSRCACKEAFIE